MRGRRPKPLTLAPPDRDRLLKAAHSDSLPWYQVRRARIVLALATGVRKCSIAEQLECDDSTVWRTGERYRQHGLDDLLADHRQGRSGRL